MPASSRDTKDLIETLRHQGWTFRKGKHIIAFPADKSKSPVVLGATESDYRAFANNVSRLRRAGAKL